MRRHPRKQYPKKQYPPESITGSVSVRKSPQAGLRTVDVDPVYCRNGFQAFNKAVGNKSRANKTRQKTPV